MADEIKYIEVITWNKKMILFHGDKLTPTQTAIGWRSNGLHVEIRFTDRYGNIWWSCTNADGCGCCRFKMINRSHPYRQSVVRIPVTAEQEARLFAEACKMADVDSTTTKYWANHSKLDSGYMTYGPNAIKYDNWGARLSFISKWRIIPMSKTKLICNKACAKLLLTEWPDLLAGKEKADLTPDIFEYMIRDYFARRLAV
jgi:hypothetical protein